MARFYLLSSLRASHSAPGEARGPLGRDSAPWGQHVLCRPRAAPPWRLPARAEPPCCASAGPRQHGSPGPELADESASRGDCPGDAPRSSVDKGREKHERAARPAPGVRCSRAGCGEQRRAGPEVQGSGHTADGQWPQ